MMICHYDDTNSSGGLDKQARLLSRTMRAAGEDIVMLASTRKWSRAGWVDDEGVRVRYFWTYASPQVSGRYFPASLIWACQLFFWVLLHRRDITVIHCHQIRIQAFVASMARKLFGIPSVLKSATGGVGADIKAIGSRKYFGAIGRRFIVRNTDRFVATTNSILEDLLHYGVDRSKIVTIPNGLRLPAPIIRRHQPNRARKALFLGRMAADKNPLALARAALNVALVAGISVDFWGRGNLQSELQEVIAGAGQQANVRYCGYTNDPGALLEEYGFLLIASAAEGLSNSMLEAMAHGVVPVATRVSGCIDHITPGVTGFYFEGTDHENLVTGLRQLAEVQIEDWLAMSRNVQIYAYERFDIQNVVQSYLALYAALARTGRFAG
jgi:glycosyltransferase involved in cell wall biosynthesis